MRPEQGAGPGYPAQQDRDSYTVVETSPWSPAQIVGGVVGLLLVVIGGVALARGGVNFKNLPATYSEVAGLGHTCLSAIMELLIGAVILAGSAFPRSAKEVMGILGALMFAFGMIVAIEPPPFFRDFGYHESSGVFYAVLGFVLLVTAIVSPIIWPANRVVRRR